MNQDLSGHWDGVYSYPRELDAVHFDAWLIESEGKLTGETSEPGLASDQTSSTVYALINGSRSGAHVSFTKVYDALGYEPIAYEGDIDADGNEIHGRWTIGGHTSGSFVMRRSIAASVEEESEADVAA